MATGQTNVDVSGMRAAQPHFEQALAETSTVYSNMDDQYMTLQGSWTGDSSAAFLGALSSWLENCSAVQKALQGITEKLAANTHSYQSVHAQANDEASALRQAVAAGLPGF
ncbi:WXG100 family type VII secretion target [Streptomyces sp. NPDC005573]|uniref:WXG100 family type VII secretion target n=1 Tax=Streptomyces sp. NPDC005573 TaxID=3156890 RepID=UPI0033AAAC68